jgi:hypothetical protein
LYGHQVATDETPPAAAAMSITSSSGTKRKKYVSTVWLRNAGMQSQKRNSWQCRKFYRSMTATLGFGDMVCIRLWKKITEYRIADSKPVRWYTGIVK